MSEDLVGEIVASRRRIMATVIGASTVLAGLVIVSSILLWSAIPKTDPERPYLGYSPIWEQDAERESRIAWPATTDARNAYLTWLEMEYENNEEAVFRRFELLRERVNGGRATYEEYVEAYQLSMILAARKR